MYSYTSAQFDLTSHCSMWSVDSLIVWAEAHFLGLLELAHSGLDPLYRQKIIEILL